jgi:hypothetical protein
MIFQAQSRLIFGVQGEDADLLGHELASITYDPKRIKEELYTRRQLVKGHRVMELSSWSDADGKANQWSKDYGSNWSTHENVVHRPKTYDDVRGEGKSRVTSERRGEGGSASHTHTHGGHETLVPEHEEFDELSSRTYYTFEEQKSIWASAIRNLPTGHALLRQVNDPLLYDVAVKRSAPGYLKHDLQAIARQFPQVLGAMDQLIEENYRSGFFLPASSIDAESDRRIQAIIHPLTRVAAAGSGDQPAMPVAALPSAKRTHQTRNDRDSPFA